MNEITQRLHARYEQGGDLEASPMFTVLYALRERETLTLKSLLQNLTGYAGLEVENKEMARRRITTHLARAERNRLLVKDHIEGSRLATYTLTDKGAAYVRSGLEARATYLRNNPKASITQACAAVTVQRAGADTIAPKPAATAQLIQQARRIDEPMNPSPIKTAIDDHFVAYHRSMPLKRCMTELIECRLLQSAPIACP